MVEERVLRLSRGSVWRSLELVWQRQLAICSVVARMHGNSCCAGTGEERQGSLILDPAVILVRALIRKSHPEKLKPLGESLKQASQRALHPSPHSMFSHLRYFEAQNQGFPDCGNPAVCLTSLKCVDTKWQGSRIPLDIVSSRIRSRDPAQHFLPQLRN
jgi:hypothetical protein